MTLKKVMEMALRRAGLNEETSSFLDNARDYFNVGLRDLSERRAWRGLFKSSTFTTTSSTRNYSLASDVMRPLSFVNTTDNHTMDIVDASVVDRVDPDADEEGSPRVVYVAGINSSTGYWTVDLYPIPTHGSTTFTAATSDVITSSGHSLEDNDIVKMTTTGTLPAGLSTGTDYYVISADTDAGTFSVSTSEGGSAVDISDTGSGTHSWNQAILITYRYYTFIADKTSSNDDTDLAATLPPWAQNAMIYFISSQYKGELGDLDGEQTDYLLYERAIANNLKVDAEAESGNTPDRMARHGEIFVRQSFNFNVNEGSLST